MIIGARGNASTATATARVELSVVVTLQDATAATAAACLDTLHAQRGLAPGALEVLLIDGTRVRPGVGPGLAARYPRVRWVAGGGHHGLPHLQGLGIAAAGGGLVALTEACCTFDDHWAATAIALHARHRVAAIGGAVAPAAGLDGLEAALFYCDYAPFVPPLTAGPSRLLPGNNVVFTRAALAAAGDVAADGFWKTFHCQRLLDQGARLRLDPALRITSGRRLGARAMLIRRLAHGRCFGAMRAATSNRWQRLAYALASPLLPALLTVRTWRTLTASHRRCFRRLLPAALLLHAGWCAGEWYGNFGGAGDTCEAL